MVGAKVSYLIVNGAQASASSPYIAPVAAIVGLIVGALLNEFLRRRNRRELYAPQIFEKRLAAYEGLTQRIHESAKVASEVISSDEFTPEQRHELVGVLVHDMAAFVETNSLYLDRELSVHCMALFIGVEDIHDAAEDQKPELLKNYNAMRNEALRMAAEDSGVTEINRLFKKINKPRIGGPFISYFRQARREADAKP